VRWLLGRLITLFDRLERAWASDFTRVALSRTLLWAFLGSVLWIELARHGIADSVFGRPMPTNHLAAVSWIVTLLLFSEVLDLVFGLAKSVAKALGKQLELLCAGRRLFALRSEGRFARGFGLDADDARSHHGHLPRAHSSHG